MPKRTFQPKKKQAKKKHGFRKRMLTKNGRKVIKRRKDKGRKKITK
ncbi:MAG: 50S ribosomal protein L34 [Patescibacteria group bacterium]|jgi:large subunit ribosomal protein L34